MADEKQTVKIIYSAGGIRIPNPAQCEHCTKEGWPSRGELYAVNGLHLCWCHAMMYLQKEAQNPKRFEEAA